MRIVHVVDDYQPHIGYQEPALAAHQQQAGHVVRVVTGSRYGTMVGEIGQSRRAGIGVFDEEGVTVHRLPVTFEVPGAAGRVWLRGLHETLAGLNPEVVHTHGITTFTAWQVARLKRALGYRLIYDNHQSLLNTRLFAPFTRRVLRDSFYALFWRLAASLIREQADAVVAVGENEQSFAAAYLGLPLTSVPIIRLGADTGTFAPNPEARQRQRSAWRVTPEEIVLIHAGQLRPGKKLEVLFRAAGILLGEGRPVRVVLIGSGYPAYQEKLMAEAASLNADGRVIFEPFVQRQVLAERLSGADIGVWPGFYSMTYIEAMAVGLPLIVERSRYNKNTIGAAGRYFEADNVEALARRLRSLVDDPELRAKMGTAARSRVETELNWEVASQRFLNLYRA